MKKLLLIPLLLCGCTGYGTISKNLAKDGAIVHINSPHYGQITRIGTTTNMVRVPTPSGDIIVNEPAAKTK